ncbi:glycoside hydrolase family 16 protein [Rhodotorula diobovata]|uniref:Glycoside hydrolase family 16 protein n=1 Tax=Rhodotorula diobovata TaxID=5288 RepID=A0A5C5G6F1_9BASI|nr:glycoside hydrolase family 16 protein [Rhodotorula diobovata]
MRWRSLVPFSALALLPAAAQSAYTLEQVYAGDTFYDGWEFWGNRDNLTNGATYYVTKGESAGVAYTNEAGNAIIRVDNRSELAPNGLRNSVRMTTARTFDLGRLIVMDALHLPYGCATWPAFWAHAVSWPSGGEIDFFEGVNLQETNQVAMHTVSGCYADNATQATGELTFNNCDHGVDANRGCTFVDPRNGSYGADFAAGGGGVYAAELASDGISVWFFPRADIPADLRSEAATPDPTTWGLPMASYPSTTCNINQYFAPQQLTINIALCGDWAGQPGVFSPTCGMGTCADYVKDPSNFDNAYFEISSIRVFSGGLNTRAATAVAAASGIIGAIGGQASAVSAAERGRTAVGGQGGVAGAVGAAAAAAGLAALALLQRAL